ncbi:hypothetical protein H4O18_10950 [Arenibacter sp. BSSL-BM3]|uniref:DUF4412 domain-containing protein n=1 Tax=Arenibacter arenosicollis TaxID=2762274 RepID=A0ABR7QNL9_9FLAO|nr:DUF6263 family protein [Arenibacter arenosicollis]MBC8768510.1 hypothetical protein [Arenibacter arenosicollis]
MKRFLFLMVCILCNTGVFGQTTLQYHLKKGDVFKIKQDAEQIITQELDGAAHEITNHIDGILEFKVLGEVNNGYEVTLTFKDLNLKMTSSIQGELMNVKAKVVKEEDMQSKIFNTILNNPVKIVLAKNGNILKVQGGDSLVAKMARASGLEDEFAINMMKKSLENEFGSEALSNSYKQMTFIYPDKKVNINDKWENAYDGKLKTTNTWTLKSIVDNKTKISGKAKVLMDITDANTSMKLSGTQTTTVTADTNSGFIINMVVESLTSGMSTMTQMGGEKIPTTIKSKITYQLIK